jgi:hypothetical protein
MAQLAKGPRFNLANSLARDAKFFADFRKCHRMIVNTKAGAQHFFFAFFKAAQLLNQGSLLESSGR